MIYSILLQEQAASGSSSTMQSIILFGGIAIVFYFFMIRPQQKKQKDQKKFINEIKKGDAVVTIGGVHGKIHALDEETVTVEVDKSTRLKFERTAISLEASKRVANK